jgi:hypothetical protein
MSYSNLIDPIIQSKSNQFIRSNTKEQELNGNTSDQYNDDCEKDEIVEMGKTVYKRGKYFIFRLTYII